MSFSTSGCPTVLLPCWPTGLTKVGDFALSVDAAAIGLPLADRSKGRKIGRSKFKRLLKELLKAGYLERRQPSSRGRSSFSYAVETVKVPEAEVWKTYVPRDVAQRSRHWC